METTEFFQVWLQAVLKEMDFASFADLKYLSALGVVFFLLRTKIGMVKALVFAPLGMLLELSLFSTLELTDYSYFATMMFVVVTGIIVAYLIYNLFIRDDSTLNSV